MTRIETLLDARNAQILNPVDLTDLPLQKVVGEVCASVGFLGSAVPEVQAVDFYFWNHAYGRVQSSRGLREVLPEQDQYVVTSYLDVLDEIAPRLFGYLLLITTREARHAIWEQDAIKQFCVLTKNAPNASAVQKFFIGNKMGQDSSSIVKTLSAAVPNTTLGAYTEALVEAFRCPSYASSAYGGPKWAAIAKCLRDAVHGVTSFERMVDEAWALSHNNGPIFNKGMLYQCYTHEIIRILDVQRGGQIPAYARQFSSSAFVSDGTAAAALKLASYGGEFAQTEVDWNAVNAAGATKTYTAPPKPKMPSGPKYTVDASNRVGIITINREEVSK